jgi:anti-anti-sigma factor
VDATTPAKEPDEPMSGHSRTPQFGIQDVVCGERHTLILKGELDLAAADYLEAVIFCLFVDGISGIAMNLSKLRFIDATGLRALLAVNELCEHQGCEFSLTRPTGQVRRLFELTGVAKGLPIERGGSALFAAEGRISPVMGTAPRNGPS